MKCLSGNIILTLYKQLPIIQQTRALLLTINLIITRCKMTLQQEVHFIPTAGSM